MPPTAVHTPMAGHDTPVSPLMPALGLGVACRPQDLPSQTAARVLLSPLPTWPTDVQEAAETHEIPSSCVLGPKPAGLGTGCGDQFDPFHTCAPGSCWDVSPTSSQKSALVQETELSVLIWVGMYCVDQDVPFHARALSAVPPVVAEAASVSQKSADVQDTE